MADHQERLKAALDAMRKQQARIDRLERALAASEEPIAVVGIGCRFPGGVDGPEMFWRRLREGFDAISEVPRERWAADAFFDADPDASGCMSTRFGGFLDQIDRFDARFFQISPREARTMDPQQRLLLEITWHALEHAGIPPDSLSGSATGVFVGLTAIDYGRVIYRDDLSRIDTYSATGNVANIAAGRLSYFFGLRGPSVAIDTACSSSLVSLHLACQSLRTREGEVALAAGVNVMATPDNFVAVSRAHMLSPDGRCKAFDRSANGYGRGEGCGVLVLKRLSDARAAGDRVIGVILGSAVRQDGQRSGLTVPNGPAQASVMTAALESARVAAREVSYLEAHGTGTALGDPIEFEALASVYSVGRERSQPLIVGSLKTNVGHMESAAGIGGVIKTLLALSHGEVPAHLHFHDPNPELALDEVPATIPIELMAWPSGYARRIAAVSSFGSSGTIAHTIIAEPDAGSPGPDAQQPLAVGQSADAPFILPISAKTDHALAELVSAYRNRLAGASPEDVADICFTAAVGRAHFVRRVVVEGRTGEELAQKLAPGWKPVSEVARTYAAGGDVDWPAFHAGKGRRRVDVPVYPFQRERHWVDAPAQPRPAKHMAAQAAAAGGLRFGVMFFNGTEARDGSDSYRLVVEAARFADANGFSSVWLPERHFTEFGSLYPNPATIHAALARETTSVRLMAGSVVLPLHNPLRLAEEWAVVDQLSGGRVGMSFASGWNPDDFALQPEAYAGRRDQLFSGIETLRKLWRGERVPATSGTGAKVDVRTFPSPIQRELPLWITAAGNPETFRRAGEIGAHLLTHLLDHDPDELGEKIAIYRRARAASGHDPAAGQVTVMLHTFLGETLGGVHEKVREPYCQYLKENIHLLKGLASSRGSHAEIDSLSPDDLDGFVGFLYDRFFSTRALLGTVDSCLPLVDRLKQIGVNEIACLLDFGPSTRDVLAQMPMLAELAARASSSRQDRTVRGPIVANRTLVDARYEIEWERVQVSHRSEAIANAGPWCVLGSDDPLTRSVSAALGRAGARSQVLDPASLDTDAGASTTADVLLQSATAHVLCTWHAGVVGDDPDALVVSLMRTVRLVRALASRAPRSGPRLWFITEGAQPAQRALWGFVRVLPIEQLALWGGVIDIDDTRSADRLLDVVAYDGREDQTQIRGEDVLAARLVPASSTWGPALAGFSSGPPEGGPHVDMNAPAWRCREDAAYLITGGFGGIGLGAAQWLAEKGATQVVLVGRTVLAADDARIRALEACGLAVERVALDIADAASFNSWLSTYTSAGGSPIAGVVHAAGVWDDRQLAELDEASLQTVFAAKVAGTLTLDQAFTPGALDLFVVFSAFSSFLPAERQANYASANAFADAVVERRRADGDRAFAINWGLWADVGFGATDYGRRAHERLESIGISRIAPAQGWAELDLLIEDNVSGIGVMPVDWRRLFQADPNARLSPMLGRLASTWAVSAPTSTADSAAGLAAGAIVGLPSNEQLASLEAAVTGIVAEVMRIDRRELGSGVRLMELGLDSLMAVEIKNRVQHDAGVNLPLVQVLEGPSIAELAASILAAIKLSGLALNAATGVGPGPHDKLEEIEI